MSAKRSKGFKNHIRNPRVIWYGPHDCPDCGQMIVKASTKDGGMSLDAPHGHNYPNHKWTEHRCKTRKKVGEIIMDGKTHEARLSA